ncbi:hypothetical protein EG240_03455 [Paenimyroides tangerinum]|uniref:Uncharacterized protein n=2 Tax=Paenimyroides tangerinum TaxID=2488728 RepID=A0A3P3WDU9_9FLAO|nr:hypothetical protein EG240_03455 [Paenimyroides tangerinum]
MSILTLQLKRLGKKKIHLLEFEIEKQPQTLKELIEQCVKSEVKRYNEKREEIKLMSFLSPKDIQEQSETGKIGFGDLENRELAQVDEAIANALLAFEDGLYVVFVDDEEIKSFEQSIDLKPDSVIAFIRLTFLTGTYW